MKAFVSWSGGKESCLSCHKALLDGLEVSRLLNMVTLDGTKSMTHSIDSHILRAQSECVGIPLIQKKTTWDTYEHDFKEIVRELKRDGVEAGVFGDIDLPGHREWVEHVCKEAGIQAVEPLWGMERKQVLREFRDIGFKAIVVCARADLFNDKALALQVDEEFMEYLKEHNIDMCGEGGEYHTLVLDGPLFEKQLKILDHKKLLKDGFWILDIEKYEICSEENDSFRKENDCSHSQVGEIMTDMKEIPILKVLEGKGITAHRMIESALLLYVPCGEVDSQKDVREIRRRLEKTIIDQCNDINVQLLISAALYLDGKMEVGKEVEEKKEIEKGGRGRKEIYDPSHIVSDELIGIAIAEYISGKKALFNFIRYDREKPGILSELGMFLDDAIGGLIAGCMTKLFEEWK